MSYQPTEEPTVSFAYVTDHEAVLRRGEFELAGGSVTVVSAADAKHLVLVDDETIVYGEDAAGCVVRIFLASIAADGSFEFEAAGLTRAVIQLPDKTFIIEVPVGATKIQVTKA